MKNPFIYFSSSGNTKYIAKLIQVGFKLADLQAELIRLKDFKNSAENIENYEILGIGGPIYAMSYPPNIMNWIDSLPKSSNAQNYFFLFDSNAGLPGNAIQNARDILDKKDYKCIGLFEQISPTRDSVIDSKYFKFVRWKKRDIMRAVVFGYKLAKLVENPESGVVDWSNKHIFGNRLRFFFKPFERVFYRFFPRLVGFAKPLCKNCKLCEESCPTRAIQFKNRPIISASDCIACFNCLRVCPTNALNFKLFPHAEYFKGPKTISGYIAPDKLFKKYRSK
ncbi:MAG: EFR1 family ferrodoxin [Promethearchaeia archaeon]